MILRILTPQQRDRLVAVYAETGSYAITAQRLGVSRSTVHRTLVGRGVVRRAQRLP